jgi:L-ascorbate metabolism protein UlaG (beta-lactamase superfamily)
MRIHQLRNATMILTLGNRHILVDPMLSEPGSLPAFKIFGGGRRRNPLVPLPDGTDEALGNVSDVLVTHEHPDHLDRPALQWIVERGLPVWASAVDAPILASKGLAVRALPADAFGMASETVVSRHGKGVVGWLMGPVAGFYLSHPDEPSVLLTGDSILTAGLLDAVDRLRPDVVVAPAGTANFGLGPDILFSVEELVTLVKQTSAELVFNHLEALDHCPTSRRELRERMSAEGLGDRVHIPADGEQLTFDRTKIGPHAEPGPSNSARPGLQKCLTAKFSGT